MVVTGRGEGTGDRAGDGGMLKRPWVREREWEGVHLWWVGDARSVKAGGRVCGEGTKLGGVVR